MEVLPQLPEKSVHTVVTSPPYFALRSYLPDGHPDKSKEIGSEPTPEAFIATMVAVFREVRRVLRDDGVCWVNLGDSYAGTGKTGGNSQGDRAEQYRATSPTGKGTWHRPPDGLEAGNLLNIPHRVAEALRQDGWIWRQTICWQKKSPMPESVNGWRWMRCRVKVANGVDVRDIHSGQKPHGDTISERDGRTQWSPCPGCSKCEATGGYVLRKGSGRCTTAHEYLFLFAKKPGYFWDGEASKEEAKYAGDNRGARGDMRRGTECNAMNGTTGMGRNPRSVWTLSTEPTSVRHFATYPSELVRRCLASAPTKVCPHCGAPWAPVVESERVPTRPALNPKAFDAWKHTEAEGNGQRSAASPNLDPERHIAITTTTGYRQTCSCPPHEPIGGTVLDCFSGIATTGQTARHLGMAYIGIELNEDYLQHALTRLVETPRWRLRQIEKSTKQKPAIGQGLLF